MAEVKLFGVWGSPFSCRVRNSRAFNIYEFIEEDLSSKSALLLQYNPVHKKVTVLVLKGKPIAGSLIITEYIDETWKDFPILPQDPHKQAMARFWAKFINEKCNPAIWKICFATEENARKEAMTEACEHLKTLENEVKDKKFFGRRERRTG